jgi:uncharacterized caspase-like protein
MGVISRRMLSWMLLTAAAAPAALCQADDAPGKLTRQIGGRAPAPARRALVVGISSYAKSDPLPARTTDARAFGEFLKKQWGYTEDGIVVMTDDASDPALKPTQANMARQIQALLEGLRKESEVVVYFAGHGLREGTEDWLVPVDGDPGSVSTTCVSADKLVTELLARKPKRALLFLDANRSQQKGITPRNSAASRQVRQARGMELAVMYSCENGERSQELKDDSNKQGVFTRFLLEGLSGTKEAAGTDGSMTFASLRKFVRSTVKGYVKSEYSEDQSPYAVTTSGSMVLAKPAAK